VGEWLLKMTDKEIIDLYSSWSEDFYCAGFLNPSHETIKKFRNWLNTPKQQNWNKCIPYFDYEQEMLNEFHKQEQEEKEA